MLSLPISRFQVVMTKLIVVFSLTFLTQIILLVGFLVVGWVEGLQDPIPWSVLISKTFFGWFASLPLSTLMLGISLFWKNFAAPFTLNVVFTVPSVLLTGAAWIGVWYPWSQPFLAMMPQHEWAAHIDPFFLFIGVLATFTVFILSSILLFMKQDW